MHICKVDTKAAIDLQLDKSRTDAEAAAVDVEISLDGDVTTRFVAKTRSI